MPIPTTQPWGRRTITDVGGVGEGAVHRGFLETFLSESGGPWRGINVAGFGAKGDGETDDSDVIQKAFDQVGKAGGGIVWFPPDFVFRTTRNMVISYSNVHAMGAFQEDLAFDSVLGFAGGEYAGSWIYYDGAGGAGSAVIDIYPPIAKYLRNVSVRNLGLDANYAAESALRMRMVFRPRLYDVHVNEAVVAGFNLTDFVQTDPHFDGTNQNLIWGLRMRDCSGFAINNPWKALWMHSNTTTPTFGGCTHCFIDNFHAYAYGVGGAVAQIEASDDIWFFAPTCSPFNGANAMEWKGRDNANGIQKPSSDSGVYGGYLGGAGSLVAVRAGDGSNPAVNIGFINVNYTQDIGNDFSPLIEDGASGYVITTHGRQSGHKHQYRNSIAPLNDEFVGGTPASGSIGDRGWQLAGAGAAVTYRSPELDHPGIIRLDTGAGAGTVAALLLGSGILSDEWFEIELVMRLNQNDTDTKFRFGLSSNPAVDNPVSEMAVEKAFADTSWFGNNRSASTDHRTSAIAAVNTNFTTLAIRRKPTGVTNAVEFSVDGVAQTSFNVMPTGAVLQPFMHIVNQIGVSKTVDFDFWQFAVRGLSRT